MPRETPPITEQSTSLDVYNAARLAIEKLPEGEDRNALVELRRRFIDYQQIGGIPIPLPGEADLSEHDKSVATLKAKTVFYANVSHTLTCHNLIDWQKPLDTVHVDINRQLREFKDHPRRLIALICEIYARGGVKFNYQALPDEVREAVILILKELKIIYD